MAVNTQRLEMFYSVSSIWTIQDQRYLAAVGFEFELAERAFVDLHKFCLRETDSARDNWHPSKEDIHWVAIFARSFVDHASRVQKLLKNWITTGEIAELSREFYNRNRKLFALRDALHHSGDRISRTDGFESFQPINGDFSWKAWTETNNLDVYWISFGPQIGDLASPTITTSMTLRVPVDQLIIRGYDHVLDISNVFLNLCGLIEQANDIVRARFDAFMRSNGLTENVHEERCISGMNGRLRIDGLVVTS